MYRILPLKISRFTQSFQHENVFATSFQASNFFIPNFYINLTLTQPPHTLQLWYVMYVSYKCSYLFIVKCSMISIFFIRIHSISIKGRDRLDMQCSFVENNFRIHLIPMRHFYGVQFLNKSVNSFVIFHQLFQSAKRYILLQIFNNMEYTCNKYSSTNQLRVARKIMNFSHLK